MLDTQSEVSLLIRERFRSELEDLKQKVRQRYLAVEPSLTQWAKEKNKLEGEIKVLKTINAGEAIKRKQLEEENKTLKRQLQTHQHEHQHEQQQQQHEHGARMADLGHSGSLDLLELVDMLREENSQLRRILARPNEG